MKVGFGTREVELGSQELGHDLRDCNDNLEDAKQLQNRLKEDGYLLVRGLHKPEAALKARRTILEFMGAAVGHIDNATEAIVESGQQAPRLAGTRAITHHPDVLAVLESPRVFNLFEKLFGEEAATLDYKWLRAVGPTEYTGSHYDIVYMGGGSPRLHTIWTPFGRITPDLGSLAICVGSHNLDSYAKLRETYGKADADRFGYGGWFSEDPQVITDRFGGQWQTTTFEPGDVIIFGMFTLHASTNNMTNRWRISCDTRFQPTSDPLDKRWIGENPSGYNQTYHEQRTPTDEMLSQWDL